MIAIDRHFRRWLAVVTVLCALAAATNAGAQDAFDSLELLGPASPIAITDAQFDQWAFGSLGRDEFKRRLELRLTARVNEVNRICPLADSQKKKLLLAGRGDIRRYFDELERTKQSIRDGQTADAASGIVFPDFRPLETLRRDNVFAEDSLLGKTLKHTLGSEQFARYEDAKRAERTARHQATLKWTVGIMDTTLDLNPDQHRRITALLAEKTRPPRKFGEYDYYGVMLQVAKLPNASVKPIFNGDQWSKLQIQLNEATRLEKTLEEGGFVPEDGVAAQAPAPQRNGTIIGPKDQEG